MLLGTLAARKGKAADTPQSGACAVVTWVMEAVGRVIGHAQEHGRTHVVITPYPGHKEGDAGLLPELSTAVAHMVEDGSMHGVHKSVQQLLQRTATVPQRSIDAGAKATPTAADVERASIHVAPAALDVASDHVLLATVDDVVDTGASGVLSCNLLEQLEQHAGAATVHIALAGTAQYCTAHGLVDAEEGADASDAVRWQQCPAVAAGERLQQLWRVKQRVGGEELTITYDVEAQQAADSARRLGQRDTSQDMDYSNLLLECSFKDSIRWMCTGAWKKDGKPTCTCTGVGGGFKLMRGQLVLLCPEHGAKSDITAKRCRLMRWPCDADGEKLEEYKHGGVTYKVMSVDAAKKAARKAAKALQLSSP
ncbi:hypothetical protein JKP88DRAFT_264498 [Tribonema minus]|uniref:Uncharacterized protein n=1 Tax=Tribonema minus TaxID=303371 RepID=A0A835YSR8_9STRA|nr:hypothetical protein JKP88DRAFT_264498 [Tribonema minus]